MVRPPRTDWYDPGMLVRYGLLSRPCPKGTHSTERTTDRPSTGEQASGSALVSVQHSDWSSSDLGDRYEFLPESNGTFEDEAKILYDHGIIDSQTFSEIVPGIEHGSIPGATDHQILPVHARTIRVGTECSGIEAPIQALRNLQVTFEHSFSCDNDKNVKKAILANVSPKTFYDDVTTRNNAMAESTDLYIVGFLCQPFSIYMMFISIVS